MLENVRAYVLSGNGVISGLDYSLEKAVLEVVKSK